TATLRSIWPGASTYPRTSSRRWCIARCVGSFTDSSLERASAGGYDFADFAYAASELSLEQLVSLVLQFNRAWSRPSGGVDIDTTIALVLARPTFNDLLTCCMECGIDRVRDIFERMI